MAKRQKPDGYNRIFRSYVFGPSGFWTMAPLRYAAKFDPFISLDCAPTPSTLATLQVLFLYTLQHVIERGRPIREGQIMTPYHDRQLKCTRYPPPPPPLVLSHRFIELSCKKSPQNRFWIRAGHDVAMARGRGLGYPLASTHYPQYQGLKTLQRGASC